MPIHHVGRASRASDDLSVNPMFARPGQGSVPRDRIPEGEMLPETAYQIVHDEAMLDGNARLNLATFVGTWMEPQAAKLYSETFDKNMIDKDEYPQTAEIEERCVRILADLWHAPGKTIGTSAIGSSEACMLGGLAFKRSWQIRRRAEGKSTDRPNLIMSSGVQVVWEKFCTTWKSLRVSSLASNNSSRRLLICCRLYSPIAVAAMASGRATMPTNLFSRASRRRRREKS